MIYLQLFLTFFEIGAVSFGGGYGMLSLMRELILGHGWMKEAQLLNFIAVSESTPGPIAVNMATFVGASKGGLFGSFCATLGVVLPSFIIILIIAALMQNFMKRPAVQGILSGIRPCVVGLILATAAILLLSTLFGVSNIHGGFSPDGIGIGIFIGLIVIGAVYKKVFKKNLSPIIMILLSAVSGGILYAVI